MDDQNQILDVSYGSFSCRLEGFADSVETMKLVVSYFHELAGHDRFMDTAPLAPDMATLARLAEEQTGQSVRADGSDRQVQLRTGTAMDQAAGRNVTRAIELSPAPKQLDTAETANSIAATLRQLREADDIEKQGEEEAEAAFNEPFEPAERNAINPLTKRLSDLAKRNNSMDASETGDDEVPKTDAETDHQTVMQPDAPATAAEKPDDTAPAAAQTTDEDAIASDDTSDAMPAEEANGDVEDDQPDPSQTETTDEPDDETVNAAALDTASLDTASDGVDDTDYIDQTDIDVPLAANDPDALSPQAGQTFNRKRSTAIFVDENDQDDSWIDETAKAVTRAVQPEAEDKATDAAGDESDVADGPADADIPVDSAADDDDSPLAENTDNGDSHEPTATADDAPDNIFEPGDDADQEQDGPSDDDQTANITASDETDVDTVAPTEPQPADVPEEAPIEPSDATDQTRARYRDPLVLTHAEKITAPAADENDGAGTDGPVVQNDDDFDLGREVEKVAAELAARKGNALARHGLPRHVEDAMSRIMSQTDQHLNQPENRRHRDAFAQLKAAVAATEAARQLGDTGAGKADPDDIYKDDLGAHDAEEKGASSRSLEPHDPEEEAADQAADHPSDEPKDAIDATAALRTRILAADYGAQAQDDDPSEDTAEADTQDQDWLTDEPDVVADEAEPDDAAEPEVAQTDQGDEDSPPASELPRSLTRTRIVEQTAALKLVKPQLKQGDQAQPDPQTTYRAPQETKTGAASARLRQIATQKDDGQPQGHDGFAAFVQGFDLTDLADQMEAAGAYICFVDGDEDFSRPQVMKVVQSASRRDISREEGLRSFGRLLRQGRLVKLTNGRFQVAENTPYKPRTSRVARG